MNRLIVADESVDFAIIRALRTDGFIVQSIAEDHAGWPDYQVLKYAFDQNAYLITEDKDFGELSYRFKQPNHGILLVRLIDESSEEKAEMVLEIIRSNGNRLVNQFSVLETHKLRIRPIFT